MARIIVIEDESAIRRLVSRILSRHGHEVREAENGIEGVALHRADPADLVLTDLFMPVQDGIETIRQIREFAPATPIVAMSGGGTSDALDQAGSYGADAILAKPFSPDELERVVRALLDAQ